MTEYNKSDVKHRHTLANGMTRSVYMEKVETVKESGREAV